jgi:hypothetical protein
MAPLYMMLERNGTRKSLLVAESPFPQRILDIALVIGGKNNTHSLWHYDKRSVSHLGA